MRLGDETMRAAIEILGRIDARTCLAMNQVNCWPFWGRFFGAVSRLGDGVAWYTLMILLAVLGGDRGFRTALLMLASGLTCTLLYKGLKLGLRRPRPCHVFGELHTTVPPLDEFSFPSGHTMHACVFTLVAVAGFPWLGLILVPFTLLIAISRPVLGLHYLSDVLVGAVLGFGIAHAFLQGFGL